jgi:hypothetical protein
MPHPYEIEISVQALLRYSLTMIQLKSGLAAERIDPTGKPVRAKAGSVG